MKTIKHYTKHNGEWVFTVNIYCPNEEEFLQVCKRIGIKKGETWKKDDHDHYFVVDSKIKIPEIKREIVIMGIIFKYQLSYIYSIN